MSKPDLTMPIVQLASRRLEVRPAQSTPIQPDVALDANTTPLRRRATAFHDARIHQWRTIAPADDKARAGQDTGGPLEPTLIVSRDPTSQMAALGVCALCWSGPGPLAGAVRQQNHEDVRAICSRCLVTLEMLAVQFDPHLRLHIETPA